MSKYTYEDLKKVVNAQNLSCAIMSVEKNADGTCGDIRYFAVNKPFLDSNYSIYKKSSGLDIKREDFTMDGELYTKFIPKEPKFEDVCFRAAWNGEHSHHYVDTTRMYGLWTESFFLPLLPDEENNIGYVQLFYTLNVEMDTGKYAAVAPDIASFVIRACMEMRSKENFNDAMDSMSLNIREFTNSFATCIMTVTPDLYKFDILSESVAPGASMSIKDIFADIPYEIVETWEWLCGETDCLIIKDQSDLDFYRTKAPEWIETLEKNKAENLCLVPFVRQNAIIGYLYIANFDLKQLDRVKDTVELMSFFLSSEVANHMIMDRLEYLGTIDLLTGVYNRNCMNVNVDELATKLKLKPRPFSVAFCSLNILRNINDSDGHDNGDQLLKDASELLKLVFKNDKIYRSGGDEFAIVSLNTGKEEFEEKIAALHEEASDPEWLSFSVGYYHDDEGGDLRKAFGKAYRSMQEIKAKFYEEYPGKKQ
jgi:diguanylate cyclase (GGDEF)-like protein